MTADSKINALAEMVFIGEIVKQTKIAKRADERLQANNDNFDELEVWCSIQSILVAAGNVSKILWPSRKSSAARGEKLRSLLDIDKCNILSDRKLRNHFEHYDERIEDWFEKSRSLGYIDSRIDPLQSNFSNNNTNIHRIYNPLTQTLTFRGESIDLGKVLIALEEIRYKCRHLALS